MSFLVLAGLIAASGPGVAEEASLDFHRYMKGRRVYEQQCVWCHGRSGRGDGEWAEGVKDKPRNFRTGIFKFRSTRGGIQPTDADLERTIRSGIAGTMMPAFKDLPADDLAAVIYYLKSLSPRWKDPAHRGEVEARPERPEWFDDERARERHVEEGRGLFRAHCIACHGESATGDGPGAEGLVDVWGFEIAPADLTSPSHKSGSTPEDLFRTVALGLDGTPMIGYRGALKDEEIWKLVVFIRSIERRKE